jgi:hypothetical protein
MTIMVLYRCIFLSSPLCEMIVCERRMFLYFHRTHKIPALLGKLLHLTVDLLRKDPNYKKRCSNGRQIVSRQDRLLFPSLLQKSDVWRPRAVGKIQTSQTWRVRLQKLRPICQNQAPLITHRCGVNPGELNGRFTRRMTQKMNNISPITSEQDSTPTGTRRKRRAVGFILHSADRRKFIRDNIMTLS